MGLFGKLFGGSNDSDEELDEFIAEMEWAEQECVCEDCGCSFTKGDAVREFENSCNGMMSYKMEFGEDTDLCGCCAYERFRSDDEEEIYDINERPRECDACGGPYPDCRRGCQILDD